jgi:hypothetical protein
VVWADLGTTSANGSIDACATTGTCGSATPPLVTASGPVAIASDATNVYWNDGPQIMECALADCQPTRLSTGAQITAIAVTATTVFWTDFGIGGTTGGVFSCAIAGCSETPTPLSPIATGPQALALDETNVYWSNTKTHTIESCPLAGCGSAGPRQLVTGEGPVALAVSGPDLFWAGAGIRTCAISECTPGTFTAADEQPAAIAVDDAGVYWVDTATDTIRGCSKSASCAPATVGTTDAPTALALDAAHVYVASQSAGEIVSVAR